jgi:GNAT superfamily N-acetyltransferase
MRIREGTPADVRPAFAVFRRALWDYFRRAGYLGPDDPVEPDVEASWSRQGPFIEHLARTAAQFWVAETDDGTVAGIARSTERAGLVELTEFFVDPTLQARGVGRSLLDRAFPLGWGTHRSVIATLDPRALSLYLRFGVHAGGLMADFSRAPVDERLATDLELAPGGVGDLAAVLDVEEQVLGHPRAVDIEFLMSARPLTLARRRGRVVGFGFGSAGRGGGPMAVLDPADLPPLLAHLEAEAAASGNETFEVSVSLANRSALDHLLARRFRLDPFYTVLLENEAFVQFDRYVLTNPAFIL